MLVLKVMHILFKKCIEKGIKKNIPLLSGIQLFCDLIDCSLPGSSVHGISPGKNTGVGCHFLQITYKPSSPRVMHC